MKKNYSTKRALIASILALAICCTMFIGTTFAWFTDEVSNTGNVVKTGNLKVDFSWKDGSLDPTTDADWVNAADGAMFDYVLWEPGYTVARHIKVVNKGNLALNYKMRLVPNGVVSELADVIDVYYFAEDKAMVRDDLADATYLGTLAEVMGTEKHLSKTVYGALENTGDTDIHTIVLKMKESAGNEYKDMDLGCTFSVQIIASQMASEEDSFDKHYDDPFDYDAVGDKGDVPDPAIPVALVRPLPKKDLTINTTWGIGGTEDQLTLDAGYKFMPTISGSIVDENGDLIFDANGIPDNGDVANNIYKNWHADFYVYADRDIPANSVALAGYYSAWCEKLNDGNWVALQSDDIIKKGDAIRLVEALGGGSISVSYKDICTWGNDGIGFMCGLAALGDAAVGATITVELRLYEVEGDPLASTNSNVETGKYEIIGTFTHTLGGTYTTMPDGSELFMGDDGEVTLVDVSEVETDNYAVPYGVTDLGNAVFANNPDIKTVEIPASITNFGGSGITATGASGGAFKGSAVETIILPEGMTEIPAAAFNGANNLKSVNIPESVETIGVNAFRSTAIETLTIPDSVETISYGAFRDMGSLTTVTIEGDVHIPNYAFRGCANLRTVFINGENATVGNSMAFANASSNNPNTNNLTFYVKNAGVAAQVKASMGVGSNYYIYIGTELVYSYVDRSEVVNNLKTVKNVTELQAAIDNAVAGDIIVLAADITGDVTIDTGVATVIFGSNYQYSGSIKIGINENVTIKNVNFVHSGSTAYDFIKNEGSPTGKNYNTTLLVENCTFVGDGNDACVAVRTTHPTNVQIENCSGEKLHSFLQNTGGQKVTINKLNVTDSKSAVSLGGVINATVSNSNISVGEGYGIRIDAASANAKIVIDSCDITAYIPVAVRKATGNGVTLTFNGESTMTETNTEGLWCAVAGNEYGDVTKADLTAATSAPTVIFNDTALDQSGLYVKN